MPANWIFPETSGSTNANVHLHPIVGLPAGALDRLCSTKVRHQRVSGWVW
jgi:hypothetical protein